MEENKRVQDFLCMCQGKSKPETCDLIKSFRVEEELVVEIIKIIETEHASQICDSICEVLFSLNSAGQEEGTIFCLQFIPALIWAYYSLISKNIRWSSSKVETLLLFIYNQIVQTNKETPFLESYSIPTLSKPSIYHEPMMGVSSMLTEHTLSQHDKADKPILIKGPTRLLDKIPSGFRSLVIKFALRKYNDFLPFCFISSLHSFCRMVIRLSSCGFPFLSQDNDVISVESLKLLQSHPKVSLNGDVMKEMVTALHFIAFNGCADIAVSAMKCLHRKACYSLSTAAVLSTDALQDLIKLSSNVETNTFEHTPPFNPYKCTYRSVNPDSIQKRKLVRQSHSTPRIPRVLDVFPIRPPEASSPRSPETFGNPAALIATSADVIDGFSITQRCFAPVFLELGKKVALIDDKLLSNNTTETDVSGVADFSIDSQDLNNHNETEEDIADTSFTEFIITQTDTPKIVIDISDLSDGKHSDEVPLINCRQESNDSSIMHTSFSPLQSEDQDDIQVNGDVKHVYDTQL